VLGAIPHVAAKRKGSAVPEDIRQSEGYAINLKMHKVKLIGRKKISGQLRFVAAIYNLIRIGSLTASWIGLHA